MSETNGKGKIAYVSAGDAELTVLDASVAIMKAAADCRDSEDPLPHAVVIPRDGITAALKFWDKLIELNPCDVLMDVTPDVRNKELAVLLFSKRKAGD